MEKYIDKDSIKSLEMHEKKLIATLYKVTKRTVKKHWFKKTVTEDEVYQTCPVYETKKIWFESIEEAYNYYVNSYGDVYLLDDNKIYRKPKVVMIDKNTREYVTYFNDDKEMDRYISSLDLDILKKYVKIKCDNY